MAGVSAQLGEAGGDPCACVVSSGRYTGRLKRVAGGRLEGWIADQWGWEIALMGEVDRVTGDWVLEGQLGEPPASLRVPAIDDEK